MQKLKIILNKYSPAALGIAVLIIILMIIFWPKPTNIIPRDVQVQLELLQREKKALMRERDLLQESLAHNDALITDSERKTAALEKSLAVYDRQLVTIRKLYATLNRYNNYNTDSIVRYFSDNYGR